MSSGSNVQIANDNGRRRFLARIAPGLENLLDYRRADFRHDLVAGLSVAAVALPVGVAYAQLAGFNPAVGLYSSILPLAAYAIFGTSRQLILGPDAATCALVAAAVAPLAGGDDHLYLSLSVALAFLAGLFCIGASFLRLGALADFLSKPILVGFLNGIALSIMLGQIGKIFGFPITSGGIVPRLVEFLSKLGLTHGPTLAVGLGTFAVIALSSRLLPRTPAALVAMIIAAVVVKLFGLEAHGVQAVGEVPAGLPVLKIPTFPVDLLPKLFEEAAGLALVSFTSMMLTSRSFASKNRYEVDADREFAALGAANIVSALSQGFAVSGADSRTAMSDATGGRTQVTGLVAAATVAAVLIFFTGPLRYVPIAALGAVLVKAALSLVDLGALRQLYQMDRREFALSILATLGVVAVGAIQGILVVVALALVQFVRLVSRPRAEVLGEPKNIPGFHALDRHPDATTIPGLVLFRFNAPITFFNAAYFKREVMAAADRAGPELKWFVIDMITVTMIDATGIFVIDDLVATFAERGILLAAAGRQTEWRQWAEKRHFKLSASGARIFPTLRAAVKTYRRESTKVGEAA
ncbi:MAG TPA: SulP family inorganic anion transporter [Candidatus Acidoferrales bacterium]|nr:SulP family inorganic anion transporter [Candidatus Acidoferrales bacterium]